MSKLPKPYGVVNEVPVFLARHIKLAYEEGRRDMLDEVLKIAPDSVRILIARLKEGE